MTFDTSIKSMRNTARKKDKIKRHTLIGATIFSFGAVVVVIYKSV